MTEANVGSQYGAVDLSKLAPGQDQPPSPPSAEQAYAQQAQYAQQATDAADGPTIDAPLITEVTTATFEEQMAISQTVPVVLVLYSPRSLASKQAVEVLEDVARADAGAFQLGKIDVETSPELAEAFKSSTIPAGFAVVARRPVPLFEGVPTPDQVNEILGELFQVAPQLGVTGRLNISEGDLERPIPPEHLAAREAEAVGDWSAAVKAWKKVLANHPADREAKTALARARFERRYEKESASVAEAAAEVSVRVAADDRFAHGDEAGAFGLLLEAIKTTNDADDRDTLRKQLIGLFAIASDAAAVKSARADLSTFLLM